MSFRALFAAWSCPTETANGFAVMVALAGHHNDETDLCCPSQSTLARRTKLSTDTVGRAIKELEAEGLIRRHVRRDRETGARISDRYDLLFASPRQLALLLTQQADEAERQGLTPDLRGGDLALLADAGQDRTQRGGSNTATGGGAPRTQRLKSGRESGNLSGAKTPGPTKAQIDELWGLIPTQRAKAGHDPIPDIRKRSESRGEVGKALAAKLNQGWAFEKIRDGLQAYYADPDVSKDGPSGPYHWAKGAQRVIRNGLFETYLPDDDGPGIASGLDFGSTSAATPDLVADWQGEVWMQEWTESPSTWRSERGPQPGRAGCRISPDIQKAHGVTPFDNRPEEGQ